MNTQETWKVALFGDGAVGKTAIAVKFTRGTFLETYDPTIEDSYRIHTSFQGQPAFLELVDTAGQDDYATLRDQWLHEGDAYVLVYAVSSRKSFMRLLNMEATLKRARQKSSHIYPVSMLIGNKYDLTDQAGGRAVGAQEAYELAQRYGCFYMETSAKSGYNITKMFETIVLALRNRHAGRPSTGPPGTIWGGSLPVSPINNVPSAFRYPPASAPPASYARGAGPSDPYGSRTRQGSTPALRPSASAYPLPRSPSLHGRSPPVSGSSKQLRGRSSTSALRSPNAVPPPPVPLVPVNPRSPVMPSTPSTARSTSRFNDRQQARTEKSAKVEQEKKGRGLFGGGGRSGRGPESAGDGGGDGKGGKGGHCIIC
ncbi:ras-domain-containing protein [Dacryopinax primogenitus]|uniref:Ras-domain-containing protein n=1 Tax=Dacryopinax primogenitus (strain DJM 731) TaxID=1858805 RepID=M5GBM6_DACPD|nr:ras-domain-containing protein [Dacryopinax primogenitus]EJU01413.1 ras-domain-containing protein [Dacryopinax primogenitus]